MVAYRWATAVLLVLAGCGGGGGGGADAVVVGGGPSGVSGPAVAVPTSLQGQFFDGPTNGITFSSVPSGFKGTTAGNGFYAFTAGDTVNFSLSDGANGSIDLGSAKPAAAGEITFVTSLPHGQQISEILHALNHGSGGNLDVGGLTIAPLVLAAINNYISSGGVNLAGLGSDDQFLRFLQVNIASPAPYTVAASGTGTTFLEQTVLPDLQASVAAISASPNAPAAPANPASTKLSGSVLVVSKDTLPAGNGCSAVTVTSSGGAILNATVNGNLQSAGNYTAQVSAGTLRYTTTGAPFQCSVAGVVFNDPGFSESNVFPPFAGNVNVASDGTNLTVTGALLGGLPAGCVGGDIARGTVIGLANPMVSLTSNVTCSIAGATVVTTLSIKMVGSF